MPDKVNTPNNAFICAKGALAEAGTILDGLLARSVFFVVDETAYTASGAAKVMEPYLRGQRVAEFADFN